MQTLVAFLSEQNNWKLVSYYFVSESLNVTLYLWHIKK